MEEKSNEPVSNAWSLKVPEFKPEDNPNGLLEESNFIILFPKYKEAYLKQCWPLVEKSLAPYNIKCELDLIGGKMTVKTTRKTWDPYIIIKARDMMKLLSRSVPVEHAQKVLEDDNGSDIIKIGNMVKNKERYLKRRQRIIGSGNCTLKSLELLSNCFIQVQGSTVSAVGPYKGLAQVRRIVEETMKNIHPVFNIRALLNKQNLMKNKELENENWTKYLPKFENKSIGIKKKKPKTKKKKPYTPFPPPMQERKIDQALTSGEYFMTEEEKKKKKKAELVKKDAEAKVRREDRRKEPYIPPNEDIKEPKASTSNEVDIKRLKKKMKKMKN